MNFADHSQIIDFVIWFMFSKAANRTDKGGQHLLCQGFRRNVTARSFQEDPVVATGMPGITSTHPNGHVEAIKSSPWPEILLLMGKDGERMMIDLIVECGIFVLVSKGHGTYYQLSGKPLSELQVLPKLGIQRAPDPTAKTKRASAEDKPVVRNASSITFVRSRALYARAGLNAKGNVCFGLGHVHVLSRTRYAPARKPAGPCETLDLFLSAKDRINTLHLLMYIFPRQFNLHNVFTSDVEPRGSTVQPFKDYTLREDEIHKSYKELTSVKTPKRLRGLTSELVRKLQIRHSRCSYKEMLTYYCAASPSSLKDYTQTSSIASTAFETQVSVSSKASTALASSGSSLGIYPPLPKPSLVNFATSTAKVSAFCRACLFRLLPRELWGMGKVRVHNERVFYRNVDRFVSLRRYENLSLHEISQGMKASQIPWRLLATTLLT